MAELVKTDTGICFVSPVGGGEFTLCGLAYDDEDSGGHQQTNAQTVTCLECAKVIKAVRDVKTRAKHP